MPKAKRGPKAAAQLVSLPLSKVGERPPVPADLNDAEAQVWQDVTGACDAGYFAAHHQQTLAGFCRHTISARNLSLWMDRVISDETEGDISLLDQLAKMRDRETRAALACARSLRLTKQATQHPATAANAQRARTTPAPWESAAQTK